MPTSPRQTRLLLSRKQRLAAVDAVRAAALPPEMTPTLWRHVAALVKAIELRTGRDGWCYCYAETLWGVMSVSRATFFRVRAAAASLGLVEAVHRYNGCGQQSNAWRVLWPAVGALAGRSGFDGDERAAPAPIPEPHPPAVGESLRESHAPKSETGGCQLETGGSQDETPLRGIVHSLVLTSVHTVDRAPGGRDDRVRRTAAGRGSAPLSDAVIRGMAERIERAVGRRRVRDDWELALKAASLTPLLSEDWLWNAVDGVVQRQKRLREARKPPLETPWAYLHACLDDGAKARGVKLNKALAGVSLSLGLFTNVGAPTFERLCQTGREP